METAILRAKKVDPSDRIGKETACRPCSTMHRKKLAYRAVKRLFDITIAAMGFISAGNSDGTGRITDSVGLAWPGNF